MNKQIPSNFETEIVKFTAIIKTYDMPSRKIEEGEKSKLRELNVLLNKLTASAFGAGDIPPPVERDPNDPTEPYDDSFFERHKLAP